MISQGKINKADSNKYEFKGEKGEDQMLGENFQCECEEELEQAPWEAMDAPTLEASRTGWMGPWATWSSAWSSAWSSSGNPAHDRGLELDYLWCPFQPDPFCDFMILSIDPLPDSHPFCYSCFFLFSLSFALYSPSCVIEILNSSSPSLSFLT